MKVLKKSDHESSLKAVTAFLIILLAFGILLLFKTYKSSIISSGSFGSFITVAAVGMAFLLILLYLVNNQKIIKKKR